MSTKPYGKIMKKFRLKSNPLTSAVTWSWISLFVQYSVWDKKDMVQSNLRMTQANVYSAISHLEGLMLI